MKHIVVLLLKNVLQIIINELKKRGNVLINVKMIIFINMNLIMFVIYNAQMEQMKLDPINALKFLKLSLQLK